MEFKLLLIGDPEAGKTAILFRFSHDAFTSSYIPTGVDFKISSTNCTIQLHEDGKWIRLQVWDTSGQERFYDITTPYNCGAMGIMIVYDITNEKTFQNITKWIRSIEEHVKSSAVKMLVGNKCDMKKGRSVSTERGAQLAAKYGMKFLEVSAKTGINVDKAFYTLARDVKPRFEYPLEQLRLQARLQATSSKCVVRRPPKGLFSVLRSYVLNFGRESASELKEQQLKASGIKVKELPDKVIYRLEIELKRKNDWEQLAGLIGFSLGFINYLKHYPQTATLKLLIQWGESEPDATVFELYTMLKQLSCVLAAELLLLVPLTIKSSTGEIVVAAWNTVTLQPIHQRQFMFKLLHSVPYIMG